MAIDPADLPHITLLMPWIDRANQEIETQVENAASHAEKSLTRSVVSANDGRQTWRTIAGQRSAKAAFKRLDDLSEFLVGRTKTSLQGHVQDARAAFYRDAFLHWRPLIPVKILDEKASWTASGERAARGLILFGMSPLSEISPVFLTARNGLQAALNAAAVQSSTEKQRQDVLDTWESRTIDSLKRKIAGMLSDSQIGVMNMVGQTMVKQEFRREP